MVTLYRARFNNGQYELAEIEATESPKRVTVVGGMSSAANFRTWINKDEIASLGIAHTPDEAIALERQRIVKVLSRTQETVRNYENLLDKFNTFVKERTE